MWLDSLHHELHVLLTGEHDGYYAALRLDGRPRPRADSAGAPSGWSSAAQNHDQIGNRALGDRLPAGRAPRSLGRRAVLALDTAPLHGRGIRRAGAVPVLHRPHRSVHRRCDARGPPARVRRASTSFAGEEVARPAGRRDVRALAHLAAPSPSRSTASCSALRREASARRSTLDVDGRVLTLRRGDATLVADFDARTVRAQHDDARVWPGEAVPARAAAGTATGRTSRSSPRTRSASSCASSTTHGHEERIELARAHGVQLALLPPGRRPGPALRLPRPRPVRPGDRAGASTRRSS